MFLAWLTKPNITLIRPQTPHFLVLPSRDTLAWTSHTLHHGPLHLHALVMLYICIRLFDPAFYVAILLLLIYAIAPTTYWKTVKLS